MNNEGAMLLIEAIVRQAAEDYVNARRLAALGDQKSQWKCAELERWFVSEWGDALCYGRGDYILQRLKQTDAFVKKKYVRGEKVETSF